MSFITFDYKCEACGEVMERMVRRSETDKQDCGKCGSRMRRMPAAPITTFKFGDRSAIKGKKSVSLRDPHGNVNPATFGPKDI